MCACHLFDTAPDPEGVRSLLSDPASFLLFGFVDEQPAGFARAHELKQTKSASNLMLLYEIHTAPEFQRLGIARALIEELKRVCGSRAIDKMFVITNESNRSAMALYTSTGAQRLAGDDVVFAYELSQLRPSSAV